MKPYPVWPLTKYSLPPARLEAIVAEAVAKMRVDEDSAIAERMSGARCSCCDAPIAGPSGGLLRECDDCRGYA